MTGITVNGLASRLIADFTRNSHLGIRMAREMLGYTPLNRDLSILSVFKT
jgi:hypothetical protein